MSNDHVNYFYQVQDRRKVQHRLIFFTNYFPRSVKKQLTLKKTLFGDSEKEFSKCRRREVNYGRNGRTKKFVKLCILLQLFFSFDAKHLVRAIHKK